MSADIPTATYGEPEQAAAAELIRLALKEDLSDVGDVTSQALLDQSQAGVVQVVSRATGVLCGGPVVREVFRRLDLDVEVRIDIEDSEPLAPGTVIAELRGSVVWLLSGERTALNFLCHLSGIASLTRRFVDAVQGTNAAILDTRKTLPGYRLLQKYAVRCGGGTNHRMGLYDAVMLKDNHLGAWDDASAGDIAAAIRHVRSKVDDGMQIVVEVDRLDQLQSALTEAPDVVLLDNMSTDEMRQAVDARDAAGSRTLLEASGGVTLETVGEIARTGVDRISIGALTHSALSLDIGFDWVE